MTRVRNDLSLYDDHADAWWSEGDGMFRSLRQVGAFHLECIRAAWGDLKGKRVVELGCGGGWLALELDARGALVSGVDRSRASIAVATRQAQERGARARFMEADLLKTQFPGASFDHCVMTDVLEHLDDVPGALAEVARLLRPGGQLFVNTFTRSWLAALIVVHLGEGLGFVPKGTHDPRLFVRPAELEQHAAAAGLELVELGWERPAWLRTLRTRTVHLTHARSGLGYHALLQKRG
jgi:2-polyprenyl-6-hydroxyphenyl methylase/3-demethylubiquinone-9 3-methyltransferase